MSQTMLMMVVQWIRENVIAAIKSKITSFAAVGLFFDFMYQVSSLLDTDPGTVFDYDKASHAILAFFGAIGFFAAGDAAAVTKEAKREAKATAQDVIETTVGSAERMLDSVPMQMMLDQKVEAAVDRKTGSSKTDPPRFA